MTERSTTWRRREPSQSTGLVVTPRAQCVGQQTCPLCLLEFVGNMFLLSLQMTNKPGLSLVGKKINKPVSCDDIFILHKNAPFLCMVENSI